MLLFLLMIGLSPLVESSYLHRESYKGDIIYHLLTDRFYDGNPTNNDPPSSPDLYDVTQNNWKLYWGGDFEGILEKLPYLKELGITAIWISPPYDNSNTKIMYDGVPNAAYHGYWARDFKRPEEHFGTWAEFDALIRTAHWFDLKIIIDWAPNHTGPADPLDPFFGERGSLYDDGQYIDDYCNNSCRCFHRNGGIVNWQNSYESQYSNIADLADLDHTNDQVHRTLREALNIWIDRSIDGIRVDAIKHMSRAWLTTLADQVNSNPSPRFIFGEWYMQDFDDDLLTEALRFSNQSGISHLDFLLNRALRNAFIHNTSFHKLNSIVIRLSRDYMYSGHNMVTFIDNHDMPRFLTENPDRRALHQALVFLFTQRGTPCLYYGLENYLHNDTNGGGDPWNRPMMPKNSFDKRSEAFLLIQRLSQLKQRSPALNWGDYRPRYVSDNILVYERRFGHSIVLVAINKYHQQTVLQRLLTSLPPGSYQDHLVIGDSVRLINVGSDGYIIHDLVLDAQSSALWSYDEIPPLSSPMLGSVAPTQVRSGNRIALEGTNFGTSQGQVLLRDRHVPIVSWTNTRIVALIPSGIRPGITNITVHTATSFSDGYTLRILSHIQIPVTFMFTNISIDNIYVEDIYLTGSVFELGEWSTDPKTAQGPMHSTYIGETNSTRWFYTVSLPSCWTVSFRYFRINRRTGSVYWEQVNRNHRYTVPCSGLGTIIL